MAGLRPITATCTPRRDVRRGLADSHFAAQLDQVLRAPESYPVYGKAEEFFDITYPTQGLKKLLARSFARLSGARVPGAEHGVIRLETSFGGGKTHGLIAAYHLAKGARPRNLAEFLDPKLLPKKCQVAAIVGDALDPVNGLVTGGLRTFTLWGELGAQFGSAAFKHVEQSDANRTAPGKPALASLVGDTPTLVIIDEIAHYLRQLASSGDADVRRLAGAVPVFLKNLFELAGSSPHLVVVITLATRADAYGKETDELLELLDTSGAEFRKSLDETHSILTRSVAPDSILVPAADEEIGAILKRRLFEAVEPETANEAAAAYRGFYESLTARGERLGGGAERPADYARQIEAAYPFHPELIRVLDRRIGAIPHFQRARGALKLLSEVIAGLWATGRDAEILNVADIDYGNEAVLRHLTIGLGRPDFEGVAKADFAGPSSHAAMVDSTRFSGRAPYATRVCRTVFAHSLELVTTAGAGRNDYLLGTLRIGDEPEVLSEALAESEKLAWHLDYDGTRWRFSTEPQPNKIIEEEAKNVPNSAVAAEVEDRVRAAFPREGLVEVVHAPTGPGSVKDLPQLQLVVLHHDDVAVRTSTALPPPSKLVQILERVGLSEDIRKHRNGLVFLVADVDSVEAMKERARRDLAAHRIVNDRARMEAFAPGVRTKLQRIADAAGLEARIALTRCYRHLYYPVADRANAHLKHEDLPARSTGEVEKAQTRVIVEALKEFGKVRTQAMGTDYLRQRAWPKGAGEVSTREVEDAFWRDHGAQLILDTTILRDAIREGTRNGAWVYYVAEERRAYTAKDPAPPVKINSDHWLYALERARELGLLGRPLRWEDVAEILKQTPVIDGRALRAALEQALGKEPSKEDVLDVLARGAEGGETARVVVVAGKPEPGARALPPTEVRRAGLDAITVLTLAEADRLSILRPTTKKGKAPVEATGAAGVAFQSLLDKASDAGDVAGFSLISVTASASPGEGVKNLTLLGRAIGMLPKLDIEVETAIDLDFLGLASGVHVGLKGSAKDYQRIETVLMGLARAASTVAGTVRLDIRFGKPAALNSEEVKQLRKVLTDLDPGTIKLTGVLT